MGFFQYFAFRRGDRSANQANKLRARPKVEALESRFLPSGASISGFAYHDANNNGLFDPGETPLANSPIELHNSADQVIATTVTDANGFYTFSTDTTANTNPATLSHTISFPEKPTDWTATMSVPQFDPSLGTLTAVEITNSDPIKNSIRVENLDTAADTIHVTVTGDLTLSGPGLASLISNLSADQTFNATAFDGSIDFGGTSGHTFDPQTVNGSNSKTLTDASDLALYTGTGTVDITEATHASSMATGSANLLVQVNTTAAATVTVIYHYIPTNSLQPGKYTIVQTSDPPGYLDGQDTAGNVTPIPNSAGTDVIHVTLGNTDLTNNDFGEIKPATLSGFVYVDANNNGTKDAGETGIAGVTVNLTGTNDESQAVSLTQVTAADGSSSFTGLRPGTYALNEVQPAGYLDGKDTVGSQGGTVSNDQFSNIALQAEAVGTNNNFGELNATGLSGNVYVDTNNNGVKDSGEAGISGVTVNLTGTDDLGHNVSQTQVTAADGSYAFTGLRPGVYALNEVQPANYLDGKDTIGSQGGTTANDQFSNITLASGVSGTNNNFGELNPASLGGFVYVDANNNGIKEPGEAAIAGVTVSLTGTNDLGNAVSQTQVTAADGSYNFTNLRPGVYTLTETQPANFLDGKNTIGTPGGTTGQDTFSNITLASGVAGANNNFGEINAASLGGFVYADTNNNGTKDPGEAGIAGVTINLTGTDDLGQPVALTQLTGADGSYTFSNLRPGTYALNEVQPAGYLDGKDSIGTQGGTVANDQFSNIVLPVGASGANNNFGELLATGLSGFVYVDANDNGVKDPGESGIAGVTVTLTGADDSGHPVNLTQTTAADGSYAFTLLRPGIYALSETQPANYLDGKDTIGSQGGLAGNDQFSNIALAPGVNGTGNDFGELQPASIGGFVYIDANNSGTKDAGESGLAGVTVTLTGADDNGLAVNQSQVTAADGSYNFTNLRPGTYTVTKTHPAGFWDGKNSSGTPGGTVGDNQFSGISLASGVAGANNNFAELVPTSVSGFVYFDINDNGVKDPGEPGISGVTITLTGVDDHGTAVNLSAVTKADGSYNFSNLRPGTYTISETQPSGWLEGKNSVGTQGGVVGNDQFTNVTLTSGQNGANNNFGELLQSILTGFVYLDSNNNGVFDPGEIGLPGVTVTLTGINDLGQTINVATTTDANGAYAFGLLRPGTYTITMTHPDGLVDGKDSIGSLGGTLSQNQLSNIQLGSGIYGNNYDFAEILPPEHVQPVPPADGPGKFWLIDT